MLKDDNVLYKICFDSLLEGICITNKKGTIITNNSSLEEIFGYNNGELLHQNIEILIPEKYRNSHYLHFESYFSKPKKHKKGKGREFSGLTKSGNIIDVEIGLNHFEYKGETYAKALITDISSRKNEELKIKKLNLGLEDEIKKQTTELTLVIKKLKKSNQKLKEEIELKIQAELKAQKAFQKEKELHILQTKFLSLAAHEFKTPLSGILTSTELIKKYSEKKQNDNIDKHAVKIKSIVNQLNHVLDDFLLLEKTETKKVIFKFEHFKFGIFFKKIVKNSKSVIKNGQKIEIIPLDKDHIVFQDKKILDIIFRNILFNAIKYSPENSVIKITIDINSYITVNIKDQGIGIPLEDQKHIFERFFRAKNALHFKGTGIGLNIVKYHVEELGGTIKFKSIEKQGSTVIVKLPLYMDLH